jgi:ribonucleoside-diphosphate reductase alpha chain
MRQEISEYQKCIAVSRYARWRDDLGRRETWVETVDRYMQCVVEPYISQDNPDYDELRESIINMEVMPSMRALATAGKALDRDAVAGYNCAYIEVDTPSAFDETLFILCCGTGVGFSVERQFVTKLPVVAEEFYESDTVIRIRDSKIGWASGLRELISILYTGNVPKWDTSGVRPAGARLKTFGGRASGPEPLEELFRFTVQLFKNAKGRKLSSLECHDLMCKIAQIVVVGGVRRSALISLSNFSDQRMANAKHGAWYETDPQRSLANNSSCFTERPDYGNFLSEWGSIYESRSGERGIFNRVAAQRQAASTGRRDPDYDFGTNPCSEIILRGKQFCNLSEVVIRHTDTRDDVKRKVRLATILGTLQSARTNFRYLSKKWQRNCEEERLLGVSLTGIMDHSFMSDMNDPELPEFLQDIKQYAISVNVLYADMIGINPSTSITCVKPSGTVSQLVDSASGIHPRYSKYYIRRIRADAKDPLCQLMIDAGLPHEKDVLNPHNYVFSFPQKAPEGSITEGTYSSIDSLNLWKIYQDNWCEHKPSITIHYKDDEYLGIGQWVWDNWESISGIAFLPYSDHVYQQAPYEAIDEKTYTNLVKEMPQIPWDQLSAYEQEDNTTSSQELACTGGACEVVNL